MQYDDDLVLDGVCAQITFLLVLSRTSDHRCHASRTPSHRPFLSASSRQSARERRTAPMARFFYCKSPLAGCSLTYETSASTTKPCYDQQASSDPRCSLECPQ